MGEWHSGKLTWRKPELVAETLVYGNLTKACVCCSSWFFSTKRSSGTWFNLRLGGFLWDFFGGKASGNDERLSGEIPLSFVDMLVGKV